MSAVGYYYPPHPAPTLGQLYIIGCCLPRLKGYEQLGVVAGHGEDGGGGGLAGDGGDPGDGKGGSRLVWWDLVGGRGAAAPSHQQEIGERRPPPLFPFQLFDNLDKYIVQFGQIHFEI